MKVGIYRLVKVEGELGTDGFAFSDFTLVTNNTQRQTSLPQEPVFELLETDYIGKLSPALLSEFILGQIIPRHKAFPWHSI